MISAEIFFFCCENSSLCLKSREGKTRREGPDLPYLPRHEVRPSKNKIHLAERERKAKVAKLNSQTANAMKVVRAQQAAKERGAFDEAALRANEIAGAPVKASSTMVASIFDSRRGGKDWQMVQRREQRCRNRADTTGIHKASQAPRDGYRSVCCVSRCDCSR